MISRTAFRKYNFKSRLQFNYHVAGGLSLFFCYNPGMTNLDSIISELKAERDKLDKAIQALTSVNGNAPRTLDRKPQDSTPKRRVMSAAARRRIAAAQRARWAKVRAGKG